MAALQTFALHSSQPNQECRGAGADITDHTLRIAVYTVNIGGYDPIRTSNISCVPHNIDAFYFLDESGIKQHAAELETWKQRGWKVISYPLVPGTEGVDSARLTGKELKFAPPKWLESGYDWLVFHDGIRYMDLRYLTSFLVERQSHALVLWDWCHNHPKCCGHDGWYCMNLQLKGFRNALTKPTQSDKVSPTFNETVAWVNEVMKYRDAGLSMPHYYHLAVIFRNLQHERAPDVTSAFSQTFNTSRRMQRDQPILPFYLSMENLQDQIEVVGGRILQNQLGFASTGAHELDN